MPGTITNPTINTGVSPQRISNGSLTPFDGAVTLNQFHGWITQAQRDHFREFGTVPELSEPKPSGFTPWPVSPQPGLLFSYLEAPSSVPLTAILNGATRGTVCQGFLNGIPILKSQNARFLLIDQVLLEITASDVDTYEHLLSLINRRLGGGTLTFISSLGGIPGAIAANNQIRAEAILVPPTREEPPRIPTPIEPPTQEGLANALRAPSGGITVDGVFYRENLIIPRSAAGSGIIQQLFGVPVLPNPVTLTVSGTQTFSVPSATGLTAGDRGVTMTVTVTGENLVIQGVTLNQTTIRSLTHDQALEILRYLSLPQRQVAYPRFGIQSPSVEQSAFENVINIPGGIRTQDAIEPPTTPTWTAEQETHWDNFLHYYDYDSGVPINAYDRTILLNGVNDALARGRLLINEIPPNVAEYLGLIDSGYPRHINIDLATTSVGGPAGAGSRTFINRVNRFQNDPFPSRFLPRRILGTTLPQRNLPGILNLSTTGVINRRTVPPLEAVDEGPIQGIDAQTDFVLTDALDRLIEQYGVTPRLTEIIVPLVNMPVTPLVTVDPPVMIECIRPAIETNPIVPRTNPLDTFELEQAELARRLEATRTRTSLEPIPTRPGAVVNLNNILIAIQLAQLGRYLYQRYFAPAENLTNNQAFRRWLNDAPNHLGDDSTGIKVFIDALSAPVAYQLFQATRGDYTKLLNFMEDIQTQFNSPGRATVSTETNQILADLNITSDQFGQILDNLQVLPSDEVPLPSTNFFGSPIDNSLIHPTIGPSTGRTGPAPRNRVLFYREQNRIFDTRDQENTRNFQTLERINTYSESIVTEPSHFLRNISNDEEARILLSNPRQRESVQQMADQMPAEYGAQLLRLLNFAPEIPIEKGGAISLINQSEIAREYANTDINFLTSLENKTIEDGQYSLLGSGNNVVDKVKELHLAAGITVDPRGSRGFSDIPVTNSINNLVQRDSVPAPTPVFPLKVQIDPVAPPSPDYVTQRNQDLLKIAMPEKLVPVILAPDPSVLSTKYRVPSEPPLVTNRTTDSSGHITLGNKFIAIPGAIQKPLIPMPGGFPLNTAHDPVAPTNVPTFRGFPLIPTAGGVIPKDNNGRPLIAMPGGALPDRLKSSILNRKDMENQGNFLQAITTDEETTSDCDCCKELNKFHLRTILEYLNLDPNTYKTPDDFNVHDECHCPEVVTPPGDVTEDPVAIASCCPGPIKASLKITFSNGAGFLSALNGRTFPIGFTGSGHWDWNVSQILAASEWYIDAECQSGPHWDVDVNNLSPSNSSNGGSSSATCVPVDAIGSSTGSGASVDWNIHE